MTKRLLFITAVALASATTAVAQAPSTQRLDGRWTGTGVFFATDLAEKVGPVPIELEFRKGELLSGAVGNARLTKTRVSAARSLMQLSSKLIGRVSPAPELDKEYFILLVTAVNDSSLTGEFHLKSNRALDVRVREGRVALTRARQ